MRTPLWLFIPAGLLASCSAEDVRYARDTSPKPPLVERVEVTRWVERFYDPATSTTCYVYVNYGISCLRPVRP